MIPPIDHDDLPEDGRWAEAKDVTVGCLMTVVIIAVLLLLGFLIGRLRGLP